MEVSIGMDVKSFHDPVFVESDGAWSQVEDAGDLLHGLSFGQQLQDLSLAFREPIAFLHQNLSLTEEKVHSVTGDGRGEIGTSLQNLPNS